MSKICPPNDDPTMRGCRSRNEGNHLLRRKRGDTHADTIEDQYGIDFNTRGDTHLETLLQRNRVDSLHQLLKKYR
jgi:hypothetical protein